MGFVLLSVSLFLTGMGIYGLRHTGQLVFEEPFSIGHKSQL